MASMRVRRWRRWKKARSPQLPRCSGRAGAPAIDLVTSRRHPGPKGDHMANPLNATFFAFRKREKGGVLTRASLGFLALAIVFLGAFIAVNYQSIGPIFGWYGQLISAAG